MRKNSLYIMQKRKGGVTDEKNLSAKEKTKKKRAWFQKENADS